VPNDRELQKKEWLILAGLEETRRRREKRVERALKAIEAMKAQSRVRAATMVLPKVSTPPQPAESLADAEDREHGLELYCTQLLSVLARTPRKQKVQTGAVVVVLPAEQVDQMCRDLNRLLRLRDPKKAA
jgi:hypothetical protein